MPELVDRPAHDTNRYRDATAFLRRPRLSDAGHMWRIAKGTGVLDVNSSYAYLLWCRDFRETSIVAEIDSEIIGFVTGFVRPEAPDTLFVWQVAVDESARGRGVGVAMLDRVLGQATSFGVRFLETTVTGDNAASQSMFRTLADLRDAGIYTRPLFTPDHFPDGHTAEDLYTIGPIHENGRR